MMRNYWLVFVLALLVAAVSVQGYFLYRLSQDSTSARFETVASGKDKTPTSPTLEWQSGQWDPFIEMRRMQDEMNKIFGDSFSRFNLDPNFGGLFTQSQSSPPLDLHETTGTYEIRVNIPGAEQNNIEVKLDGKRLIIRAQTAQSETGKQNNLLRRERFYGHFQRILTLPGAVKPGSLLTEYKDGVLFIRVEKQ